MIKKFNEYLDPGMTFAKLAVSIVAGQYLASYLIGKIKDMKLNSINRDHVKDTLNIILKRGKWDIKEYGHIIVMKKEKPKLRSDLRNFGLYESIYIDKDDMTVYVDDNKLKEERIKFKKNEFNKILSDVYWFKEINDNIDDCLVDLHDIGVDTSCEIDLERGKVLVELELNGITDGFSETEWYHKNILLLRDICGRCESLFDCVSKIIPFRANHGEDHKLSIELTRKQ